MPSFDKKSTAETVDGINIIDADSIKIAGAATKAGSQNIVTVEVPHSRDVESFEPSRLNDSKRKRYSTIKAGFANSDVVKNSRFRISELTRGPLSVEQEEEKRIEGEIERRLVIQFEKMKVQVERNAYEEGFSAGKEEAIKQMREESRPKVEAFEKLLHEFDGMRGEMFKINEEFLMRLIYRIIKRMILRELKEDEEYTKRLAIELLDRLGTKENVKIYIGEAAFSSAELMKQDLAQTLGEMKNISIEVDPTIPDRGCRVETEFGEIDARIQVQLDKIAEVMGAAES